MSTRSPFFLSLYVGGKRLIRLKSNASPWTASTSKVTEKVLLLLGESLSGTISNSCSVHSSSTDLEATSTEPKTSSVRLDCSDAVKEPL